MGLRCTALERRHPSAVRQRPARQAVPGRSHRVSNRSKSDRDPGDWLPRKEGRCRYVREYVAVKTRWRLAVDRREKRALLRTARGCKNVVVTVRRAKVIARVGGGAGGSTGGDANTGTDPKFAYCYQAKDAGYGPYYQGKDPEYDWYTDSDSDGVVCE
jgi:hypothetical protein